jgi:hypothetical protein
LNLKGNIVNIERRGEDVCHFIFDNVEAIDQACADKVFRVFAAQHPKLELVPVRANKSVQQMIQRVLSSSAETDTPKENL